MKCAVDLRLTDRLLETYCSWREACVAVRVAYERFATAGAAKRSLAFAAYAAALDREEIAAREYAAGVQRLTNSAANTRADAAGARGERASP
jgi:hypothetical protein